MKEEEKGGEGEEEKKKEEEEEEKEEGGGEGGREREKEEEEDEWGRHPARGLSCNGTGIRDPGQGAFAVHHGARQAGLGVTQPTPLW